MAKLQTGAELQLAYKKGETASDLTLDLQISSWYFIKVTGDLRILAIV